MLTCWLLIIPDIENCYIRYDHKLLRYGVATGDASGEAAGDASGDAGNSTGPLTGVALRSGAVTGVATIGVGASIGGVKTAAVGAGVGS